MISNTEMSHMFRICLVNLNYRDRIYIWTVSENLCDLLSKIKVDYYTCYECLIVVHTQKIVSHKDRSTQLIFIQLIFIQ